MSVKSLRVILVSVLAATVLVVFSASVWAASGIIDPNASSGKSGGDYELERNLGNGINLVCLGVTKNLYARFVVTSEEDTVIKVSIDASILYDSNGGRYERSYSDGISIGGVGTSEREIIGGVPTGIIVPFGGRSDAAKFPKMVVNFQGQELTFRDVPSYTE